MDGRVKPGHDENMLSKKTKEPAFAPALVNSTQLNSRNNATLRTRLIEHDAIRKPLRTFRHHARAY
ncbi:hypothetical protein OCA5_c33550 [Afipia carboxidovorans OM5]|uniref:Uncharacterized protein n=1 Tax=Afipia carboxidovorans (strain ATCC 49405 / DSM 1227 / KCTC 32145 / OM5) TaxID=504832 RepID=F8BTY7_AFIC5|nr:hypothetical protein OCA4_c33030 [Afipia carboxidovorans OM4]AEI08029.1 hypothetical protein OCA5_c33550 [Afipia carboxidovorans OM5]